ncbi:hypothetical protein I6A84_25970 [Frankia sp. CNm7]|uniref:Polyketide cyclase n=1 Tax=Frankia nepalensis TaxID=1836974 RepID=A0A937UMS6_9ACTN|nr:hypothetical protein [Frankia nepalensis]MBL7502699.1 hypothetical protein [Frankia nepalensis]MBL7515854.1 hypothetical protein [Frankia nepalensis]MBL7521436.1 hypothetical protein [Frankia nepalensis]MBL7629144.1 hypothetical protein [Frankia nepalensis]
MGSIYLEAVLDTPADLVWDFVDRYTRSEVHVFSACAAERREGEYRVVTLPDGEEVWERNLTVDPDRRRASYTVPALSGTEYHHAEMRVDALSPTATRLTWVTDYLPHDLANERTESYQVMFDELVAAVTAHATSRAGGA